MAHATSPGRLGTFAGVFTPSILTILGIILFLRTGFVVGNAGLVRALVIVAIANLVSVLTSFSLAAISTNIEVRGGGDYYLISRTLGLEFGGAIGVVLFLAQSVSIAFYAIGFGEAVASVFGTDAGWVVQIIAAVAIGALFFLAWAGADVASRFQFAIMGILFLALVAFYVGAFRSYDGELLRSGLDAPAGGLGFWAVFAIFFPAVTGFTQGVSMSGDLRDPGKSLPRGTFIAVGLSMLVYFSVVVLLAGNATSEVLIGETDVMNSIAVPGFLIDAGVIAATLSSAMASFLGAPRILQSLASDKIFPILNPFAKGVGSMNNPRRGVLLALVVALATVALGDLNAIAPVVSMFFLISYGLLNYATYFEARAKSPSFRPRFRFYNKRLSLWGAGACLIAMLAINVWAGVAAVAVLAGIYQYLVRTDRPDRWVDATHSHHFQRAKESITALAAEPESARNWRPQILAFSADPERRARLLRFAAWLEGDSGLTAAIHIVQGDGITARRKRESEQEALEAQIADLGLGVHARAVLASDGMEALPVVVQSFGLGSLRANTALFGWPEASSPESKMLYIDALRDVNRLGVNVVTTSTDAVRWRALEARPSKERRIDVWWNGDDDTSRLALLGAYLFTRTEFWSQSKIRVISSSVDDIPPEQVAARLLAVLEAARIRAVPEVLEYADPVALTRACAESALVLLPMRIQRDRILGPFDAPLDDLVGSLPVTAGILAGAPIDLVAGPESGTPAQLAAAEEALDDAEARLRALEDERSRIAAEADELRTAAAGRDADLLRRLSQVEIRQARVERRALSARARVDAAKAEIAALRIAEPGNGPTRGGG